MVALEASGRGSSPLTLTNPCFVSTSNAYSQNRGFLFLAGNPVGLDVDGPGACCSDGRNLVEQVVNPLVLLLGLAYPGITPRVVVAAVHDKRVQNPAETGAKL